MISIGYECEYFVQDASKVILFTIPSRYPRDAMGDLVEVRSAWYSNPLDTLSSFVGERTRLSGLLKRDNLTMLNIHTRLPPTTGGSQTAGFHIHFSEPSKQMDLPRMIRELDAQFHSEINAAARGNFREPYRMKPHGWEYRMLPSTIDPVAVTSFLDTWRFHL